MQCFVCGAGTCSALCVELAHVRLVSQPAPVLCVRYNCTFGRAVLNHAIAQLLGVAYPLHLHGSGVR